MDRIVLAGINSYPGCPLRGCINDILNMKSYLTAECGIDPNNIHMLLDRAATTDAILSELSWLAGTPTGARAYFHYSGHGAQVDDPHGLNGLADVICPVDFDWSPQHMITDKQFLSIFGGMATGVHFNWASDSCHSGDLDRDLPKPNGPKMTPKCIVPPPGLHHKIAELKKQMTAPSHANRAMLGGMLDVGFASGCRSDQTSADTEIAMQPCGAFTAFYLQALRANKGAPFAQVVAATAALLSQNGYSQQPQAQGARINLPLFG